MLEERVAARANGVCELCGSSEELAVYPVPASPSEDSDTAVLACERCRAQLDDEQTLDTNHWRCLNDAMWSPVAAVQVLAWRMLNRLSSETWAQDLLDMMYIDDATRQWAEAGLVDHSREPTLDANGTVLAAGDTVHLTKDLDVKGTSFTAKRGTAVRNISLSDNPAHIEGRVNGTRIVIIAEYTKKA
ncbi:PhnA domain-containing protein [Alteromonas aestuariivivens]|uniref:PhnA domain-containing protein n=1 Tax=Alteromonas aestuariivivens TaxID=1938339 RepID=UPI001C699F16|nr:alkylphosphonate utilization protein [Alteromonas aestuariivivens]